MRKQELAPATLEINRQVALRLPLRARICQRRGPALAGAVVFESSMRYRGVFAFKDVMQENPFSSIFGHGKSDRIGGTLGRHAAAAAGVAQVAEVAQHGIVGRKVFAIGAAAAAEAAAQRQPVRERPADREGSFRREEKRTSHSRPILVPAPKIV